MNSQEKNVVFNVYKYFVMRKKDKSSYEYANDINLHKTVSEATGFSISTIKKIVKEGKSLEAQNSSKTLRFSSPRKNLTPKKRIIIDCFIEGIIRRKIYQNYTVKKCLPTLKTLTAQFKEDKILHCSSEYLRVTLHRLGFKFVPYRSRKKLLIERHHIMRLRWNYLSNIKKYRQEEKPIIFVYETYYVNQNKDTKKNSQSENDGALVKQAGKELQLNIMHAGSRNGFIQNALVMFDSHSTVGDYHGDMNAVNFQKWIDEKLLPNIPQNSVIVMDNNAYNIQIDRKPTMCSSKTKMYEWLDRRGISYDQSMRKCDLLKLITEHKCEKTYKIDGILKEQGHIVLRLPPNHLDLNPMEFVWKDIKGELAGRTSIYSDLENTKSNLELLFQFYSSVQWRNYDDHVITIEDEYYESDKMFDSEFDKLIKNVNEDDAESDEESESDMEIE